MEVVIQQIMSYIETRFKMSLFILEKRHYIIL